MKRKNNKVVAYTHEPNYAATLDAPRIPEQELADLEAERDSYKQHAEALAAALRWLADCAADIGADEIQLQDSRAALAAWDNREGK
jgi:hypothetical protein